MTSAQRYKGLTIKKAVGGIAVFDGQQTIFINQELFKYPKLLTKVLEHEVEHFEDTKTEKKGFQELTNMITTELKDLKQTQKSNELLFFALKHPRAFLPYMTCDGKKIIIANQLFIFLWALILCGLIIFVIGSLILS